MVYAIQPIKITESGRKEFGRLLKEFRLKMGLSQRDAESFIEDKCGQKISFNSISAIERGCRNIDMDTLFLFAQSGYGGMSFAEMADILSDRRLSLCERSGEYKC